jgi:DNA-binding transcriptional LysR family regulator
MLDLRRLSVFHSVATRRSFSAAALALSYTQSGVSEAVAALERELGVTLLDRSSRPVGVTPAGEVVLRHAETLLGQVGAIEEDLAALGQGDAGPLRLAGFFTAWSTFLPRAVAAFSRAHPRVVLELDQADPPEALRRLRAGESDLAVIYRFEPGDPADDPGVQVVTTRLAHDPYAVAVPARGPLARKRDLQVADLAGAKWCAARRGTAATDILVRFCREHGGFEPDLAYPADDVAMAQPLVAAGLAVALLPALNLARPYPGVAVRALPQTPPGREIWCLQPANRRLPAARAMVASLERAARDLPRTRAAPPPQTAAATPPRAR